MTTAKVANANRMKIAVMLSEDGIEDGIVARFADGYTGTVPFGEIPETRNRSGLQAIELANPYEIVLTTTGNEKVELPWDFVRHNCDQIYRPRMEMIAAEGRRTLGARVRASRETAGLT